MAVFTEKSFWDFRMRFNIFRMFAVSVICFVIAATIFMLGIRELNMSREQTVPLEKARNITGLHVKATVSEDVTVLGPGEGSGFLVLSKIEGTENDYILISSSSPEPKTTTRTYNGLSEGVSDIMKEKAQKIVDERGGTLYDFTIKHQYKHKLCFISAGVFLVFTIVTFIMGICFTKDGKFFGVF